MPSLREIERAAARRFYPADHIHDGVNTAQDLARVRGVVRQQEMLREYARRKVAGEFPDGPEVRGV